MILSVFNRKKMTQDANGNELQTGDDVQAIKDLDVSGSSMTIKQGETIKKIKLTDEENLIECKIGKTVLVLKTEFFKKKKKKKK